MEKHGSVRDNHASCRDFDILKGRPCPEPNLTSPRPSCSERKNYAMNLLNNGNDMALPKVKCRESRF